MSSKAKIIGIIIAIIAQQTVCYLSLDMFSFFYMYESGIESGTLDLDDLPLSFKGIALFVVYFLFVFGVFIFLNIGNLILFLKLNLKFNLSKMYSLGYILACFSVMSSYILAVFLWIILLVLHGFPDYFPDNGWRWAFIMLKPYHPGTLLFLLLGNTLFYSFFVPIYIWIIRQSE